MLNTHYYNLFHNNYAKYKEEPRYLKVGRWPPCHVLHVGTYLGAGGRGAETPVLL